MGKIKKTDYLTKKVVKSVKIEGNAVVFLLKNDEKITLFAAECENKPLKSNTKLTSIIARDTDRRIVSLDNIPEGEIRGVGTSNVPGSLFFSCWIGQLSLDLGWRLDNETDLCLTVSAE